MNEWCIPQTYINELTKSSKCTWLNTLHFIILFNWF